MFLLLLMFFAASTQGTAFYPENPAGTEKAIYVTGQGITRFDSITLTPDWHSLSEYAIDDPVVTPTTILVGSSSGLFALDPDSGNLHWHIAPKNRLFSPAVADGIAYTGGQDGSLRAIHIESGKVLWQRHFEGWIYPPAIAGNRLLIAGQTPRLRALDTTDGRLLWEVSLSQESVYRPVVDNQQRVIVTTFAGEILAFSAEDGTLHWKVVRGVAHFSPVVSAQRLYFRTFGDALTVLAADNGAFLWETPPGTVSHQPALERNRMVTVDNTGKVTVSRAATGQPLWQQTLPNEPIGKPMLNHQRILLFTVDRGVQRRPRPIILPWETLEER